MVITRTPEYQRYLFLIWDFELEGLVFYCLTDYSKDLASYLQYCKDVVFAGLELSFEDLEEENIIENLWDFYQNQQVFPYNVFDRFHCSPSPEDSKKSIISSIFV